MVYFCMYMKNNTYFIVTGILFIIVAVLHGMRIVLGWEFLIGGAPIPMWASWVAFMLIGFLAYYGFRLRGEGKDS